MATRSVACYWLSQPTSVQVDSSYCVQAALPQPASTQVCNANTCVYQYVSSPTFSSCSASCGGGTQTRSSPTTCQRSINGAWQSQPLTQCASVLGYTVSDTRSCNTQACDTYAWQYGSWGSVQRGMRLRVVCSSAPPTVWT